MVPNVRCNLRLTKRAKEREKFRRREGEFYVLGESALTGAKVFEQFAF